MNIRLIYTWCLCMLFLPVSAQKIGEWHSFLASGITTAVTEADNRVYGIASGGTLYSYGIEDQSITFYSRQNGLSDMNVKLVAYNKKAETLIIVYTNGNVDLMHKGTIYNLPFLKNAIHIPNKEPINISFHNETAYLTSKYGVHEIHLTRKEFGDTYPFDMSTYAACRLGDVIYAATEKGLRKGNTQANLLDIQNWASVDLTSSGIEAKNIRQLVLFKNQVCLLAENSGIYSLGSNDQASTISSNKDIKGLKAEADHLMAYTSATLFVYNALDNFETIFLETVNDVSSLKNNGTIWLASGTKGLTGIKRKAANQYETIVANLNLDGPKYNLNANMIVHKQKLLITGGGAFTNRFLNPGALMAFENNKWTNLDDNKVSNQVGYSCMDYTGVAVSPTDDNHYFVSTYGEGVLEIKNNELVQLYNYSNSSLKSIFPGDPHYVRVGGICFDKNGYLWMTNCQSENGIVVRKPDGKWTSLYYPGAKNVEFLDKILITSKGHKWVNVPHNNIGSKGMLVFDDKKTPENNADDVSNYFTEFKSGTNNPIKGNIFYSMAEDQKGEIWIGTNSGPIICSNPSRAIESPSQLTCNHIIRSNDAGELNYFLEGEPINAIAVDGGNRKWIGTASAGLFLVSPDGLETILHFNMDNSPLYSNTIQSLAINHETGEVYVGTNKGLLSYRAEAINPSKNYSDVYAYPNPVRPAFDGQVVITGLMKDSNVKITDLAGNLIYQGKSAGGQMMWNCKNHSGKSVASGVYLVLSSTPEAKESVVAKIAVVE